jgi:hypothetical protein
MAAYQDTKCLTQITHATFDMTFKPGATPHHSGIYRCIGCEREVVAEELRKMPPQDHHHHSPSQGAILWKLIVYAEQNEKK